mmetsp:Transcript_89249/g.182041  ORF Transcript_89249/g.182041 Transcript_89249/m.182041 type:complete len:92 (+) Transcript_89249:767-1042(+)
MVPTNGNVTNEGTKNTGNHLANSAAPGVSRRCNLLSFVDDDFKEFANKRTANRAPHPPSDEGNLLAIFNRTKKRRNAMSNMHHRPTDNMDF